MKVVILGATRGMGRSLARQLAQRGDHLFLLGRNLEDLARSAADLGVRAGTQAPETAVCDLERPETFGPALTAAREALGGLEAVVVTAALFAGQEELETNSDLLRRLLETNVTGTLLFCEEARRRLLAEGGGRLCVFSSVAGERGRKPVVLYGATKAALSAYLEGLDHRFHGQGLRVVCIKPGFVKTGMTAGLDPPPLAGEPERVARDVVRALDAGRPVTYTPWPWRWVMAIIRRLPRWVMRRVGF